MVNSKQRVFELLSKFVIIEKRMPIIDHLENFPEDSLFVAEMIFSKDRALSFKATSVFSVAKNRGIDLDASLPVFVDQLENFGSSFSAGMLVEIHASKSRWHEIDKILQSKNPHVMVGFFEDRSIIVNPNIRTCLIEYYDRLLFEGKTQNFSFRNNIANFSFNNIIEIINRNNLTDLIIYVNDKNPLIAHLAMNFFIITYEYSNFIDNNLIVDLLLNNLNNPHFLVSGPAAEFLSRNFFDNQNSIMLDRLLTHPNPFVRFATLNEAKELVHINPSFVVPLVSGLPEFSEPSIRDLANLILYDFSKSTTKTPS